MTETNKTWKEHEKCKYNPFVECEGCRMCGKCGWNPDVDKQRKKEIQQD